MANKRPIILASSSESRRRQLARLGIEFDVASPDIDETPRAGEYASQLVTRLSEEKARKVASSHPSALIIGGDQTAEVDGEFLNKPGSRPNAISQLTNLSGRVVTFVSGLCVLDSHTGQAPTSTVECTVKFRPLSATQIENYVDYDEPFQSAGSFKAEQAGIGLFEYMRSDDPSAITGMPLIALVSLLEAHGYQLFC